MLKSTAQPAGSTYEYGSGIVDAYAAVQAANGGGGADTQAPSVLSNLTSTGKTNTSVSLSWSASTDNVGVTGYEVYQGNSLVVTVTSTSATVSGLTPNTAYTFTVKAKDAAGNRSAASNDVSVTTNNDTTTPNPNTPWAPGVAYKVGDLVSYGGSTYQCLQAHTSLTGWEPANVPALWLKK
ncbi:carbohydrate-binding protein [Paenibacillus radicibacter]|uniref:carbohydrate-binding protein n=1 Tax=Paenibacillus radicibacter TaxID=2972488 RepID=UPI00358F0926